MRAARCWTKAWWGSGEPIWLTSVARADPVTPIGTLANIRFVNISAVSENGALLSARPDAGGHVIRDLSFTNVTIAIIQCGPRCCAPAHCGRYTNYTCARHEYRPSPWPQFVPALVDVFCLQHVDGVVFQDSAAVYTVPRQSDWGACLHRDDAAHVDDAGLVCQNGPG